MSHLTYEESKGIAFKTIVILAIITVVEVTFALFGKGYIIEGLHLSHVLMGGVMIILSAVKAYLIMYEFMHLKYELPGMVKSILIPTLLLIWLIIALLWEGGYWNNSRANIVNPVKIEVQDNK